MKRKFLLLTFVLITKCYSTQSQANRSILYNDKGQLRLDTTLQIENLFLKHGGGLNTI